MAEEEEGAWAAGAGAAAADEQGDEGEGDDDDDDDDDGGGWVEVVLVLEGGRVGAELGNMALLELGSALAAVTCPPRGGRGGSPRDDDDDVPADRVRHRQRSETKTKHHRSRSPQPPTRPCLPRWIDDPVPLAASSGSHPTAVIASVPFPSLAAARAAVNRCALTRMALVPMTAVRGDPAAVARAVGAERAGTCAAQVLAPGRKGTPRAALEKIGAELWDAGVGRHIAADRAWLEALALSIPPAAASACSSATTETKDKSKATVLQQEEEEEEKQDATAAVYLLPEGLLCEVAAWGLASRAALRAVEAPNAMPPEQAFLALNAARVAPGDAVMDPCVGGGAVLAAALHLGAGLALGADTDAAALAAAEDALRRHAPNDAAACRTSLVRASLLDALPDADGGGGGGGWFLSGCRQRARGEGVVEGSGGRGGRRDGDEDEDGEDVEARGALRAGDCRWCVDAIVTDLPYGVRSAAVGVGEGPGNAATPADMLDALLRLARAVLRRPSGCDGGEGGRVAVWLQHWDGAGGMEPGEVRRRAENFGFEVERFAAESRKTGVRRALYVMSWKRNTKQNDNQTTTAEASTTTTETGSNDAPDVAVSATVPARSAVHVYRACEEFGARADAESRRALAMHARLRRNENYGRVAADGGQDVWRAAWVGDVAGLNQHLFARPFRERRKEDGEDGGVHGGYTTCKQSKGEEEEEDEEEEMKRVTAIAIASAVEPAGARNTPLLAAVGFGRTAVAAALLDAGARVDDTGAGGVDAGAGKKEEEDEAEGEEEEIVGATPLMRAAEFGHLATVTLLLERGADPTAVRPAESGGGTALHGAAERGHAEVVSALVSALAARPSGSGGGGGGLAGGGTSLAGALSVKDANGRTALEAAARWGHAGVVRALLVAHAAASSASSSRSSTSGSPPAVPADVAARLAALAVRWGHREALHAVVQCAGHGAEAALGAEVAAEAKRWSRGKIIDVLEEWRVKSLPSQRPPSPLLPAGAAAAAGAAGGAGAAAPAAATSAPAPPSPPSIPRARLVHWDPSTGAAVLYAPSFWEPTGGLEALRAQVVRANHPQDRPDIGGVGGVSGYLPRDDPLVG